MSFCNGEIIQPLQKLYEVRTKLNSFFDPSKLSEFTRELIETLGHLKRRWFSAGQDYGLIEETIKSLTSFSPNEALKNFKVEFLVEIGKKKAITGRVIIVSENDDQADINWMIGILNQTFFGRQ
jgi:hypothetical protein